MCANCKIDVISSPKRGSETKQDPPDPVVGRENHTSVNRKLWHSSNCIDLCLFCVYVPNPTLSQNE